jgi:hypothetical protein
MKPSDVSSEEYRVAMKLWRWFRGMTSSPGTIDAGITTFGLADKMKKPEPSIRKALRSLKRKGYARNWKGTGGTYFWAPVLEK